MKARVYLETTLASYLTARPSRDLVVAAHQELTLEWWNQNRGRFDLFVSDMVLQEARQGDPEASILRLTGLSGIPILEVTEEARELARQFISERLIPAKAVEDAFHVAIATVQGMDYLLTWNCRHIANAEIIGGLVALCDELGFEIPTICTPEQLMGH